jgi:hypothetical protein
MLWILQVNAPISMSWNSSALESHVNNHVEQDVVMD